MAGHGGVVVVDEWAPTREVVTSKFGSYLLGAEAEPSRMKRGAVQLDAGLAIAIDAEAKRITPPGWARDGDRPVGEPPALAAAQLHARGHRGHCRSLSRSGRPKADRKWTCDA
jgi:hypothetical protein